MSYCRFSFKKVYGYDSQVYVYRSASGTWVIHDNHGGNVELGSCEECLVHLLKLRSEGLEVPEFALERLKHEIKNETA